MSTTVERGLKNDGCERGVDFGHKKKPVAEGLPVVFMDVELG